LTKELTIVNDKLMREQQNIRNRYQIDEIQKEAYVRGDVASYGVRQTDFLTAHGIPIVEHLTDKQLGEEYLERQRAWNELDNASRDIKKNIGTIGLIPIPEMSYIPRYDLEREEAPIEDEMSPTDYHEEQIRFDQYKSPEKPAEKIVKKETDKKKPAIDKAEIDRIEKERQDKFERDKIDRMERERKDKLDREKRDQEREKLRKDAYEKEKRDRELKSKEEIKTAPSQPSSISASVKNPFAKKMGSGGKKLEPIPDQPTTTYGGAGSISNQPKTKPSKMSSGEVEDEIPDIYDFNIGDKGNKDNSKKQKSEGSIKENISEDYSGFEEDDDPLEYNF